MNVVLSLVTAAFSAAYGARLLFQTRAQLTDAQRAHERRMADRTARGHDAYADELRSLQAYRPITSITQRRILGGLLLLISIATIALTLFAPE